jgi:hypothetical protein
MGGKGLQKKLKRGADKVEKGAKKKVKLVVPPKKINIAKLLAKKQKKEEKKKRHSALKTDSKDNDPDVVIQEKTLEALKTAVDEQRDNQRASALLLARQNLSTLVEKGMITQQEADVYLAKHQIDVSSASAISPANLAAGKPMSADAISAIIASGISPPTTASTTATTATAATAAVPSLLIGPQNLPTTRGQTWTSVNPYLISGDQVEDVGQQSTSQKPSFLKIR